MMTDVPLIVSPDSAVTSKDPGDRLQRLDQVKPMLRLQNIDAWLYRASTIVSNHSSQSFAGLPSRRNMTLIHTELKSLSYAFPRYSSGA